MNIKRWGEVPARWGYRGVDRHHAEINCTVWTHRSACTVDTIGRWLSDQATSTRASAGPKRILKRTTNAERRTPDAFRKRTYLFYLR